jgi:cytidylate kinase
VKRITIAIDGYSSCGKSTLAKALAAKLGYSYIDTGAMYRAVTLYFLRNNILDTDGNLDEKKAVAALSKIKLSFVYDPRLKYSETYLDEENVEKEIRNLLVSGFVSKVSAVKEVRQKMVALQQRMGKEKGVVLDGRDIGTTVFPDAELKLFMTADENVRVQRRHDEYTSKGQHISEEEVRENLRKRDYEDTNRKESPLAKALDAIELDNSDLDKKQQLDYVLRLVSDMQLIDEK